MIGYIQPTFQGCMRGLHSAAAGYVSSRFVHRAFRVHTAVCEERGLQGVHKLPGVIYLPRLHMYADVAIIMIRSVC